MAKILIVDDHHNNRKLLVTLLGYYSHLLLEAADGAEALDIARRENPDLVIADVLMPTMDGYEFVQQLRNDPAIAHTPVIFCTANYKEREARTLARDCGVSQFIVKPIKPDVMLKAVNAVLDLDSHPAPPISQEKFKHDHARLLNSKLTQSVEDLEYVNRQMDVLIERTRRNDQFLSQVSHELRSPLTAIYQFVTILLDGLAGNLNAEQREYLEMTLSNTRQLRALINDLLESTRAEQGKLAVNPQHFSIAELIQETLATLSATAAAKSITLDTRINQDLPKVYADPTRVRQILTNLLNNGIKFTPQCGAITVRAYVCDGDRNDLCVTVADTGCGISAEGTQKVFERFHQEANNVELSRQGLGLGLYICKELIARQGGRIWVESKPNQGSQFFFTLPVNTPD